jgi:lysophospholipase L1-like esterase
MMPNNRKIELQKVKGQNKTDILILDKLNLSTMKYKIFFTFTLISAIRFGAFSQTPLQAEQVSKTEISPEEKTLQSQWANKRVAFFGDSMTDKRRVGTTYVYWEYLTELIGIQPLVYGINGNQWDGIYRQAKKLHKEKGAEVDAILIFAGTNDYNRGIPIGSFLQETIKETNHNGKKVSRKYRVPIVNDTTFCGRINKVLSYLKDSFPEQQVVIMTPIHRGYAKFNLENVQPDENYANAQGLYLDAYVNALKQAASYWSVPLIDLHSLSGLYPLSESHAKYFNNKDTDMLHPNANGDYRLAKTIQYQLLALPSTFVTTQ